MNIMRRRSFLTMLGVAPIMVAIPAVAKTSPRDPEVAFRSVDGKFRFSASQIVISE